MRTLLDMILNRQRILVPAILATCGLSVQAQEKIDRGLDRDGQHPVFVQYEAQLLDGGDAFDRFCRENGDKKRSALRKQVITSLRRIADESRKATAPLLKELQESQSIRNVQPTWIVNGFFCLADAEACRKLAAHEAVDFVHRQRVLRQDLEPRTPLRDADRTALRRALARKTYDVPLDELEDLETPWNLERVRAPKAWPKVTGRGAVIAMIDTGLATTPSLLDALWRNPGETKIDGKDDDGNGYVDDVFGWNFARGNAMAIGDARGHGSMCASIAVGRPALGRAFGVAPNARIMMLRGAGVLTAYEYALVHGADVLSMSYMWVRRPLGHFRGVYRLAHEHLCIGGVVSVGGVGNFAKSAPRGQQIALPKDIPCVLAAAGVLESGELAPPSSRGPVSWKGVRGYEDATPASKPDLTTCFGGYPVWAPANMRMRPAWKKIGIAEGANLVVGPRGNSFSGPHVAGAAALVFEAHPELPAWRVQKLLLEACEDRGPEGHDDGYGAGLLQIDRAVEAALRLRKG